MEEQALPTLSTLMLDPKRPFIHRDLSWIQFNDRVLEEARQRSNPLLKRLKFLSISSSNLDEFFMIRFASVVRAMHGAKTEESRTNLQRVHGAILESVRKFASRQQRTLEILRTELSKNNLELHLRVPISSPLFKIGRKIFEDKILPQLAVKNDFSVQSLWELQNLQSLVFVNREISILVPKSLPPVLSTFIEGKCHGFFLDDLLLSHLDFMIPVKEKPGILRITRDADFTIDLGDEDTESIPDLIRTNLHSREKGRVVRLQHNGSFPKDFLEETADKLKIDFRQCLKAPGTLALHGLFSFVGDLPDEFSNRPGFSNPPLRSTVPLPFQTEARTQIFPSLREVDFVLHHPYDSFDAFLTWLKVACDDPQVVQIEQTIYRTDSVGQIVALLKEAAPKKKVRVMLELRARFDESNNLKVAEELSKAGAEVSFGFGGLKLHAKITLVTRKEGQTLERFTHLATGNYNAKTARHYTDISILTANKEIGDDARHFFDSVFKREVPSQFKHLVIAPTKLHSRIRTLIKAEAEAARQGKPARVFAKVNALVDEKIIEDLYQASQAGVFIDLVVRGACSLIPGVKGLSDRIRVFSIVDRFLEHSRIYYFSHSRVMYLSSADWMPRNFFSRLEIAFPVLDDRIYRFMSEVVIPGYTKDNQKARRLTARGTWEKPRGANQYHRAQEYFEELASQRYAGTPLYDHPFFQRSNQR
jgi:polyphosphate kinase